MHDCAAESIAEDLLYVSGKALFEDDFDMFSGCFELPQMMETVDGRRLITTRGELEQIFRDLRALYAETGVTDMARAVISAEFLDCDTVGSTHVTSLLNPDGQPARTPFPTYWVIRRFGNAWRIVSGLYVIFEAPCLNGALMSTTAPHTAA